MNRSLLFGLPAITLAACAGNAFGALQTKGSRVCDSSRVALVAIDASYTLTNNNDKIIYCAAADDPGGDCRPRDGEGGHTLQYRVLAGTWANVPTSNGSGPHLASSGTVLSNGNTVADSERRCNSDPVYDPGPPFVPGFQTGGKEFTNSTNLEYVQDWSDNHTEGQWALDFSTAPDDTTYEFRVRWGTKDCSIVNLTYPAQITTAGGAGPMTANGSRICDSSRVALAAIDASYTLTNNSNKIIYAAGANDPAGCEPTSGEGGHSLEYRILAGSWANVPTSNGGGPFLAASGTVLSNNSTVTSTERRANTTGTGTYQLAAREFTISTNLDYAIDFLNDRSEGQWALDFSNCGNSETYEFRVRWAAKNCGDQYLTCSAQITTASAGGLGPHHWDLDETSGTTAADSIGSSDGTLNNFPGDNSQWSCFAGGSLLFDGSDDYVSLPTESDYDFTTAMSVAVWVNVTNFDVAEQAIVTKGDTAWRLERNAGTDGVQFTVAGLSSNTVVQGSISVNDDNWHHVAGVYDGSDLLLYVDGQLDNSVTATGTMDTNGSSVYFGANAGVAGREFNGRMDDVYIYDTALTPAAVLALAQQSQLGWWKLDETTGTSANDQSAYANDGTLTNMAGTEWTTGVIDNGLNFDGSNHWVNTTIASNTTTTVTMMAWFKSDDAGAIEDSYVRQRFVTQRDAAASSRLGLGINNDRVAIYWDDSGSNIQENATVLVADTWYHAAVTYDGANVRLYFNGVEDTNSPWAEASMSTPSTNTFEIGAGGGVRLFAGVLDDVRLYDRAVCAAEVAAIYAQGVVVAGGQSHHWTMNETSGTTTADSLGSSDGTLWGFPNDGSQWTCQNGGSLTFDGVDDYVALPTETDYDFTTAITVASWIQVTSFGVAEQAIITKGDTAWRLERNASTNAVQFTVDGLATNTVVQGSVSVNDGAWHHVAGVYDGADLLLYVDGVLDNSVTATGAMDTNDISVYFGDNAEVAGRYFEGLMDDVYIYDTALTPSAILALAQESMLGWWKLDETTGTTANDDSAYGNDGSLQNMDGSEWTTGRIDNGLDFDGSEDWIDTTIASNLSITVTMTAWFKSDAAGTIGDDYLAQRFLTQRRTATSSRLALGINNDRVAVYWYDGGSFTQESTTPLVAGVWYHAALTYDGATIRLYVNGAEEGNWAEATMSTPSANTFEIGAGGGVRLFAGVLDDVRLYDRAVCAAEVAVIYAQGAGGVRIVSWREVDPFP